MARPKLIEDPDGMVFEYIDEEEAEFLYEVRNYVAFDSRAKCIAALRHSNWACLLKYSVLYNNSQYSLYRTVTAHEVQRIKVRINTNREISHHQAVHRSESRYVALSVASTVVSLVTAHRKIADYPWPARLDGLPNYCYTSKYDGTYLFCYTRT